MPQYLKEKTGEMLPKETPTNFNHDEHMIKVQKIAGQIIELAKQLQGEEQIEEEAEENGSLYSKVMKKV